MTLNADQANAVYDILVKHADASVGMRRDFVFHLQDRFLIEYRFQGALGFGGKFWNSTGRWYVTAYPEDMTLERQQAIDDTNAALAALKNGETA